MSKSVAVTFDVEMRAVTSVAWTALAFEHTASSSVGVLEESFAIATGLAESTNGEIRRDAVVLLRGCAAIARKWWEQSRKQAEMAQMFADWMYVVAQLRGLDLVGSNACENASASKRDLHSEERGPEEVQLLKVRLLASVWPPRLLLGLALAERLGQGPVTAAQLARVLNRMTSLYVPATNVARAFRDVRGSGVDHGWWEEVPGQRYILTADGRAVLERLLTATPHT